MQDKKSINIEIGANIKFMREKAGLTQEQLSEQIGIGVKSLSAIERGAVGISLTTLRKICTTLSITADSLIFGVKQQEDFSDLTACLERLNGEQLQLVREMLRVMTAAFHT